jgi:hypothetical protein
VIEIRALGIILVVHYSKSILYIIYPLIYFCDKIQIVFDVKQPKTSKLRVKIIYSKIITFTETRSFVSQEDAGSGI